MRPALIALALLAAGCDVLDPMWVQEKAKPYRPSPWFEDGLEMRQPVPGAVAREEPRPAALLTGLGADGKPLARSPLPLSRQSLELGRARFEVHCAACHGLLGDGDSAVARNMSLKPPPSLHLKVQNPDGYFYQVIAEGYGYMPSYASALTVEERWAVVGYLRALQLSQRARLDLVPPAERARLLQGGTP